MTLDDAITHLTTLRDQHGGNTPLITIAQFPWSGEFSPVNSFTVGMYAPGPGGAGTPGMTGDHYVTEEERLAADDPAEHKPAPANAVKAVFAWPTN